MTAERYTTIEKTMPLTLIHSAVRFSACCCFVSRTKNRAFRRSQNRSSSIVCVASNRAARTASFCCRAAKCIFFASTTTTHRRRTRRRTRRAARVRARAPQVRVATREAIFMVISSNKNLFALNQIVFSISDDDRRFVEATPPLLMGDSGGDVRL